LTILTSLGLATVLGPTGLQLAALYIAGLILLDKHQNGCRITRFLPARCHDAINRLLRLMLLPTRAVMGLLIRWARAQSLPSYLCLDDIVVEKRFSRLCPWTGWTYSTSLGRKVYGLHIVVVFWCTDHLRVPVAFRLWRPRENCRPGRYRTKIQLAQAMIIELRASGLPFEYVAFDCWYNARWFTKFLTRCRIIWVSTLKSNSYVIYRGQKLQVRDLTQMLKLRWRKRLELRAVALQVYLPGYGTVRLVVTRNGHGNEEYIVTNALEQDLTTIVRRKQTRWDIEVEFRNSKQLAGLGACECRVDQAMVRHVALALLTCVVLQRLRRDPSETVDAVKERWQLYAISGGLPAPTPLHSPMALTG